MNERSFFAELKRRNVYKVAVAYAVVGWLVIQVCATIVPALHLPEGLTTAVVVLVLLGFPIALVIAWAFEMTPEGMKRTEDISPGEKIPHWSRRKFAALVIGVAALAAALLVWQVTKTKAPPISQHAAVASDIADKSIAVMPFASLSEDKANTYFAEGIQDEILTRLSKIADLKVISRTSTQQYQSKPGNLSEIAKQLGVAHIVEGSVQKSGDAVRVNVQLIRAEGDSHIWAETYDRKMTDIFAVETEVAQRIAGSLEAKLTGREKEAVSFVSTKVPAAYDAYLRAVALRNSQSPKDRDQLIEFCRQAVALDPAFAAAWALLAEAEGLKYVLGERNPAQAARTEEAAKNALRLDRDHGFGHAAMGEYLYYCLQEYDRALNELQQAREQAPNDSVALGTISAVKRRQGKLDESIELALQVSQRDPLNQDLWVNLAWTYRGMRNFPEAHAMMDRALAIVPNDRSLLARKVELYSAEGDLKSAAKLLERLDPKLDGDPAYFAVIGLLASQRRFNEAIAKIATDLSKESAPPMTLAAAHLYLGILHGLTGNRAEAEPLLEQALREITQLKAAGQLPPSFDGLLLIAHAALGHQQEVERLASEFVAHDAADKWQGPAVEADVARAYAILGDRERAVSILQRLLSESYADCLTAAQLRDNPLWDRIRDDPRFQRLCNDKKP